MNDDPQGSDPSGAPSAAPDLTAGVTADAAARRALVVVTEHLADEAAEWLAARCEVVRAPVDDPRFAEAAPEVEALVVRTYTQVDAALLSHLPRLKVVARAGVGIDNIDLEACRARGVQVVFTPDANTQAVVEYVLCLLCDALRPRLFLDEPVERQEWDELRQDVVGLWQMNELVIGILGLGRIGKRVAEVARAIGFTVLYHDVAEIPESERRGAECVTLERLFAESDVLSIHVDGRPSNRRFVGRALLERMRPDAILINTARGCVVDPEALADWLRGNPAAQALLDVHDPEPITDANPLLPLPNAHLAPHLASRTMTAMDNMSWVVKDVAAVLEGRKPRYPAW
jgi:D-3-phosphoglycerate dehydrogenase